MSNQYTFKSRVLIIPGLGNSGPEHWQTKWEQEFGFSRVLQKDWESPYIEDWIFNIEQAVCEDDPANTILVGHSLACTTIVSWAKRFNHRLKGALLVAPSDTEAPTYPEGTRGFKPMALHSLQFPSLTIASSDDYYVTPERATYFAMCWQSKLITIGTRGHINATSNLGRWEEGLNFLKELDS